MVFEDLELEPFDATATDDKWSTQTILYDEDMAVSDGSCLNTLDKRLLNIIGLLDR